MKREKKICLACSVGGHLQELLQLRPVYDKHAHFYVVNERNQVTMKSFVPKNRFSHYYVVESGLKPGERVVYEGVQSLRDGMTIVPKVVPMDTVALSSAVNFRQVDLTTN